VDKGWFVEQLKARLRASAGVARREGTAAAIEAREGASPMEKSTDARVALEYANLAGAQLRRAERASEDVAALERFHPGKFPAKAPIGVGAVIEVDDGEEGRTLFLAPVGAGVELTMPDGDGFLVVVTPASPLGRAVLGRRVGETVEVTVQGDAREWTVTYVA
jgi:transcription elongation GreA/GreB family factor